MRFAPTAIATLALACAGLTSSHAASVYLSPATQNLTFTSATTASFDLFMNFAASEATLGGGIDLDVAGPATFASFTPSSYFTSVADPAFTGFGTLRADNDLEIHFGSFGGLSGLNNLGTVTLDVGGAGTTTLGLAINGFFGGFFTAAGAAQTVDLAGSTLTVSGVPEPETWALMFTGLGAIGALMRRRSLSA